MAAAVVDRVWRPATAEAIEAELADLWRAIGRREPVARAVMSNLVVLRDCVSPSELWNREPAADLPLDEVVARHPSRVIILSRTQADLAPKPPVAATVGVVTYGPPQARYGVERIAIRSSCADRSLPSIVRRLIHGDIPTSIWWADDLSSGPLPEAIAALGRQLVFDSRRWGDVRRGIGALTPTLENRHLNVADLNWSRLAPIRQAFLHAGDELRVDELNPGSVRIVHRPGDEALAWLLACWLSTRLDWPPAARPDIREGHGDDETVLTVEVGRSGEPTTISLSPRQVVVRQRGWPEYTMAVRTASDADIIANALKSLFQDACLLDTLRTLARLSAATSP